MSIEAWKVVLCADIKDPSKKVVLLGMANHAHPDGTNCYPSVARLSIYTGLSERSISRTIAELVEDGLIKRAGPGHRGSPAGYELNMHSLSGLHHERIDRITGKLLPALTDSPSSIAPSVAPASLPETSPGGKDASLSGFASETPATERRKADSGSRKADSGAGKGDSPSAYPSLSESNLHEKPEDAARPSRLAPENPPSSGRPSGLPSGHASADQTLWVEVLTVLRQKMNRGDYLTWVENTYVERIEVGDHDASLLVAVGNDYARRWLNEHVLDDARTIATQVHGRPCKVLFAIAPPR